MLMAGELDMGHARALLSLPGSSQVALAQKIVAQGLSVREAERMAASAALVSGDLSKKKLPKAGAVKADMHDQALRRLAQNMADIVGLEVEFKNKGKGGELRFYFSQFDELDSLMKKLGLESN
jgi:ParB family chromosome partitioning protein